MARRHRFVKRSLPTSPRFGTRLASSGSNGNFIRMAQERSSSLEEDRIRNAYARRPSDSTLNTWSNASFVFRVHERERHGVFVAPRRPFHERAEARAPPPKNRVEMPELGRRERHFPKAVFLRHRRKVRSHEGSLPPSAGRSARKSAGPAPSGCGAEFGFPGLARSSQTLTAGDRIPFRSFAG